MFVASCDYLGPAEVLENEGFHGMVPILHCPPCGQGIEVTKGKSCLVCSVKAVEKDVRYRDEKAAQKIQNRSQGKTQSASRLRHSSGYLLDLALSGCYICWR